MVIIQILVNKARLFSLSRARIWLFAMGLVLAAIFAYRPAWNGGFVWDDEFYVTKKPSADGAGRSAPDLVLARVAVAIFPAHLYLIPDRALALGPKPTGYHWVNILLHTANALLLWRLLTVLRVPGAWLAAGIFALHPVRVESAAWDHRAEECADGFFLFTHTSCVGAVYLGS